MNKRKLLWAVHIAFALRWHGGGLVIACLTAPFLSSPSCMTMMPLPPYTSYTCVCGGQLSKYAAPFPQALPSQQMTCPAVQRSAPHSPAPAPCTWGRWSTPRHSGTQWRHRRAWWSYSRHTRRWRGTSGVVATILKYRQGTNLDKNAALNVRQ